jgi:singapore isolate B (sub-type 7) whole genome shotgun sequence assembly, scaffold_15
MATSGDISVVAFYRSAMKTLRLQLSELDDDFFLLSQGEEGEMREAVQGDGGKQRVNRTNFVIKCLEVGTAFLRFL